MTANVPRTIQVAGQCGIPSSARAVALNLTAIDATSGVSIQLFPASSATPPGTNIVSTTTSIERAGFAVISLSGPGAVSAVANFSSPGQTHVTLDVSGYFDFNF